MNPRQRFESLVLPHLDAAYNLARWLLRGDAAAEDAVQDAALRAFRHIDTLRGEDARPWLLAIVRNTCFTMLERSRGGPTVVDFDEAEFEALRDAPAAAEQDPALGLEQRRARAEVDAALRALSPALREVVVLREFEDLEYAQIAQIAGIPVGTVMSRLSRARDKLRQALSPARQGQ